jgi:serine/threonine-protein kinase
MQPLLAKAGSYLQLKLSPDGQRLALNTPEDVWVYEWQRNTMTRLTFGGGINDVPVWSPDGRYIAFEVRGSALGTIFWVRSDGAGKPQALLHSKNRQYPWSFTPDGKRLAFTEQSPETQRDIWTVPLETDGAGLRAGKPEVFLQTPFDERNPSFSPDGRWLAYASDESGNFQIYVRAFPDKGGKWQISNDGGLYPTWSRNGRDLFFETPDNHIMVATYETKADSFVADKPRAWSDTRLANVGLNGNYDLAPDGKRIAALMPGDTAQGQQARNHVIFLMNFFDELRRRVPAGKQ